MINFLIIIISYYAAANLNFINCFLKDVFLLLIQFNQDLIEKPVLDFYQSVRFKLMLKMLHWILFLILILIQESFEPFTMNYCYCCL